MRRSEEEQGSRLVCRAGGILLGSAAALGVCLALLLAASAAIASGGIPLAWTDRVAVGACAAGSFAGGVLAVGRCGGGAAAGVLEGAGLFLLLLTAGVLFFEPAADAAGAGILCACLLGGTAAGMLPRRVRRGGSRKRGGKAGRRGRR